MNDPIQEVLNVIDQCFAPARRRMYRDLLVTPVILIILIMLLPLFILFFMMLMVLYGPRSLWRTLAPHFFVSATTTVSLRRRAGWLGVLCWYLGVIIFVITLAMYKLSFSQGFLLFIFVIMPIVVLVGSACRVGDYPQTELEQNDIYKQVGILTIIQILTPILFLIFINIF